MTRDEIVTFAIERKASGTPLSLDEIEQIAEDRYQVAKATCRVQRLKLNELKRKLIDELRSLSA